MSFQKSSNEVISTNIKKKKRKRKEEERGKILSKYHVVDVSVCQDHEWISHFTNS